MIQMTLGNLISVLEEVKDKTKWVKFDFDSYPDRLHSWRGIYSDLAVGYQSYRRIRVSTFLKRLKFAVNKVFTGYKGGEYIMDVDTRIWIEHEGQWQSTRGIVGVTQDEKWVILNTGNCEENTIVIGEVPKIGLNLSIELSGIYRSIINAAGRKEIL